MWPKSLIVGADPDEADLERWAQYAHPKDAHVLAAAAGALADWLVTFNTRHFYSPPGVKVGRPGEIWERMRAVLGGLALANPSGPDHPGDPTSTR